ncbi:MAG TPA: LysR substrate-binding domain-containing protein [Candidatus Acidoferrum sp.]|nr:LysR substrate-binding domain-containing protein [Candidatus Acidoferrum sp.]
MELRHLRYFVTVAELLSFTRAATRLRVAQPALSRQIRDLEDELGAPLLVRNSRGVRLSEAGAVFLPEAKAVLQRAAEAAQAVRAVVRGERGEIHVGYAPTPTVELLPCTLHAFQNLAPGVRVTLHDLSTEELLRGLHDGRLDLCLMVRPEPKALRGLRFELLREYPMCVALSPAHPLAKLKRVVVEQLVREPLVAYTRSDYPEYHAMLVDLFRSTGQNYRVVAEQDSASALLASVESGRGVAVVPACMSILAGGRVRLRPLHPAPDALAVGTICRVQKLSAAAQKFLQAAREVAKEPALPT